MTEYKREVLYMKKVEHGRVLPNRSFSRLECRDGDLLLHLSIQEADISPDGTVFLIYQKDGLFFSHQLGTLEGNFTCDFCSHMQYLPKSISFRDICGLLVGDEDCYLTGRCGSIKEDIMFSQIHFPTGEDSAVPSRDNQSAQNPADNTDISEDKLRQAGLDSSEEKTRQAGAGSSDGQLAQNSMDSSPVITMQKSADSAETAKAQNPQRNTGAPAMAADSEAESTSSIPSYLKEFEPVYPFEDNEWEWCLHLKPSDFTKLPMEHWHYQKNSFLLMGFYNFHHLLYAHKENKNFVGVPGQFCRREQYLAGRFGFSRFKGTKRKRLSAGDFGYWIKEV